MNDRIDEEIEQYGLLYSKYLNVFEKLKYNQELDRRDYLEQRKLSWETIKKILSAKKIMETLSDKDIESLLNDISENPNSKETFEKVINVVKETYGEKADRILNDRGDLSFSDIPNFNIFEEDIIDTIGIGGVHTFLTYKMAESEKIISEMVEKPELFSTYKEFESMTDTYFPSSAIGLDNKLQFFYKYRDLVKNIVEQGKQDELKDNLILLLRDDDIKSSDFTPKPDKINVESLSTYRETRNAKINEQINAKNDAKSVKELIQLKFFGTISNTGGEYNSYDHKKFLQDYLTFHHTEFSDNELDLVELYSIIEEIEAVAVLKELNSELDKQELVIDPVQMKSIDNKIVESYKKEYLESLLTVEKARDMVEDPNNQSYKVILKPNGDLVYEDHIQKSNGDLVYENYIQRKNGEIVYKDYVQTQDGTEHFYQDGYSKHLNNDGTTIYSCKGKNLLYDAGDRKLTLDEIKAIKKQSVFSKIKGRGNTYNYRTNSTDDVFRIDENGMVTRITRDGIVEDDKSKEAEQLKKLLNIIDTKYNNNRKISALEECKTEFFQPEMFEAQLGDIEQFVLYGVQSGNLMLTEIRGEVTSPELREKSLIKSNAKNSAYNFDCIDEDRIYIEKNLEGGISTRSFYFKPKGLEHNENIGMAFTSIDPNSIIGFYQEDARTSHGLKALRPAMLTRNISDILEANNENGAEIATLRYEYDISKIREGTRGGKVEPDYIIGDENNLNKLRKWAVAFSKPIITLRETEKQDVISQDTARNEREESGFIKKVKQIAEKRKSRDIQSVGKEIKESYVDKGKQEQDREI